MKINLITLVFLIVNSFAFSQVNQNTYNNYTEKFEQKKFKIASIYLDTLLLAEPKNNYWLLSKVELESELKNVDNANEYLEKLIQNGYRDIQNLLMDQSLNNLKSTPKFKKTYSELELSLSKYKLSEEEQEITISVPPMLECYVIMLYLGNPNHTLISDKKNHPYFKKIDKYFESYKNHPLVLELAKIYPSKDDSWINNLRAHHNLRTLFVYDSLDINTIKRFPIELDFDLARMVHEFGVETKFMQFYNQNIEFYTAMENIIQTNYSFGSKVIPFFNNNFDLKINRFNVYFSPIYGGWQHGPTIRMGNYIESFYFGGIMYTNTEEFYYPTENLLFTLLTEFDHTTVNELTLKHIGEFNKFSSKLALLNKNNGGGYYTIEATIDEYITWAFALQYFFENTPNVYESLEKDIVTSMEKYRGFIRFKDFMEFYKNYINNREKYPMLKDFYPEIIEWMKNLK